MPILKYIDVIIGLSIVMLIVATVALSVAQTLLNACAARARHLSRGLGSVLAEMHPPLLGPHARQLAEQMLLHPMIAQPRSPLTTYIFNPVRKVLGIPSPVATADGRVPGAVILREELALCLLERAAGEGQWAGATDKQLHDLREALKARGIEDPVATLRAVRLQSMENECAHPEQSAQLWRSQALVQSAPSEFVAILFQSFDTAMARATASFGTEAQVWVSVVGLVIVAVLQLDTFALVNRLSVDDAYRESLVQESARLSALASTTAEQNGQTAGAANTPSGQAVSLVLPANGVCRDEPGHELEFEQCEVNRSLDLLHSPTLDLLPKKRFAVSSLPGILVSWLLVSLGAPFWYDLLKNSFQLRSVLAQRDQGDRVERTAPSPTPAVVSKPDETPAVRPAGSEPSPGTKRRGSRGGSSSGSV
jgi:hypothetical protein